MSITTQQIDLWRQTLSETQHLEFKEAKNQFGLQKLYEYCVGIANERGGYLLLGIADRPPRSVVGTQAFRNPVKAEEKVFQKLGFRVQIEEVAHRDGRVVVVRIPSRPHGTPRDLDGRFLMRVGATLVPMTDDQLRTIHAETEPNWDRPSYNSALVIANLIGAWNEKNQSDLKSYLKLCVTGT